MEFAAMRRFLRSAPFAAPLAALTLVLGAGPVLAAPALTVAIDHSSRLHVARAAGSVIVGNPAVADVTVVDPHTLFVSGRGYGVSEIVVLDDLGRTVWQGEVVVTQPNEGQVSVYRGTQVTEMACSGLCAPSVRSAARSSGGAGGGGGGGAGGALGPAPHVQVTAPQPLPML
jgi:hypothetical protein